MKKFSKLNIPKDEFVEMSVKRRQSHKTFKVNSFAFFFSFWDAEDMI